MGKTRDLFKKIRDTKGTFHAKMGSIKDRNGRDLEIKLSTSAGSSKKQEFQKNIYFCFMGYAKAFDCVDHNNCGKFFKRWEYQTT